MEETDVFSRPRRGLGRQTTVAWMTQHGFEEDLRDLQTKSNSRQQPPNDQLRYMPRRSLKYATDDHEEHAQPNGTSSAPLLAVEDTNDRTCESAELKCSDDNALNGGIIGGGEDREEGLFGDDASHHGHVVTEEPEGAGRNAGYSELKR